MGSQTPTSNSHYESGITTIDAGYTAPGIACLHLLVENGHAAFFDTGTSHSLPNALAELERQGLDVGDVDYVVPTHVHLDHAGGAGAMMRAFPNAELLIHPRGAQHMIDPSRLLAGTESVYGAAKTRQLYGEIVPVPEQRVRVVEDDERIDFHGRMLHFLDTPGHARHHFCVIDERHRGIFSGDTLGISYRVFDCVNGPFLFPSTTPVQFEPRALHLSVDRLAATDPHWIYLTHFGRIEFAPALAAALHRHIDAFVAIAASAADSEDPVPLLTSRIGEYLFAEARRHTPELPDEVIRAHLAMDVELNAQGIYAWLQRDPELGRRSS